MNIKKLFGFFFFCCADLNVDLEREKVRKGVGKKVFVLRINRAVFGLC